MRKPHFFPDRPTTCDFSDLLNEVAKFTNDNPLWFENPEDLTRMARAYGIITMMSGPDSCTDEECEYILTLHRTLQENHK